MSKSEVSYLFKYKFPCGCSSFQEPSLTSGHSSPYPLTLPLCWKNHCFPWARCFPPEICLKWGRQHFLPFAFLFFILLHFIILLFWCFWFLMIHHCQFKLMLWVSTAVACLNCIILKVLAPVKKSKEPN